MDKKKMKQSPTPKKQKKALTIEEKLREHFLQLQQERLKKNKEYGFQLYTDEEINLVPTKEELKASEQRLMRMLGVDLDGPFKEIRTYVRNQWDDLHDSFNKNIVPLSSSLKQVSQQMKNKYHSLVDRVFTSPLSSLDGEKRVQRMLGIDLHGPFKEVRAFARYKWDRFREVAPYFFHLKKNRRALYGKEKNRGLLETATLGSIFTRFVTPSLAFVGGVFSVLMSFATTSKQNTPLSYLNPQQYSSVLAVRHQATTPVYNPLGQKIENSSFTLDEKVDSHWVKVEEDSTSFGKIVVYGKTYGDSVTVDSVARDYLRNVKGIQHPTKKQMKKVKQNLYVIDAKTPEEQERFSKLFSHVKNLKVLFYGHHYTKQVKQGKVKGEVYIIEDTEKDRYFNLKRIFPGWKAHPYESYFGKQFQQQRNYAMRKH